MRGVFMPVSALTGSRLRERRGALVLRQGGLAATAGGLGSHLNLIEHNRRRISENLLEQLAQALGQPVAMFQEGVGGAVLEGLRAAAAEVPGAEVDRIEDFAGRYPGWAGVVTSLQQRAAGLQRALEAMNDRMSHDPHLSASLHEVLSAVSSVRSTAAILADTEDIEPEWRARFHRNLHQDSERLALGAEALVSYLDTAGEGGGKGGGDAGGCGGIAGSGLRAGAGRDRAGPGAACGAVRGGRVGGIPADCAAPAGRGGAGGLWCLWHFDFSQAGGGLCLAALWGGLSAVAVVCGAGAADAAYRDGDRNRRAAGAAVSGAGVLPVALSGRVSRAGVARGGDVDLARPCPHGRGFGGGVDLSGLSAPAMSGAARAVDPDGVTFDRGRFCLDSCGWGGGADGGSGAFD